MGSSCGGIIILASAGSFPQAPSLSTTHLVLGYFQLGSTSAFAPLVGHLGPGSLINELVPGAAPMQQPLTITTQTMFARDTWHLLVWAGVGEGRRESKAGFSFKNRICEKHSTEGQDLADVLGQTEYVS